MKRGMLALVGLTIALAGCKTINGPASIGGGECKLFRSPTYEVRGKTRADQAWIDTTVETGIAGCGWERPKRRLAPVHRPKAKPKNNHEAAPTPPPKPKWYQRWRRKTPAS